MSTHQILGEIGGRNLPDVVSDGHPAVQGRLDRVGMRSIETIVTLPAAAGSLRLPARVDAFVSLDDPRAKGIHMSRIVLAIEHVLSARELTPGAMAALLRAIEEDQESLSRSAVLSIRVDFPVKRKSLRSGELGTRIYPLRFDGSLDSDGTVRAVVGATITYSSSCPCSASLAHQLLRDQFLGRFGQLEKLTVAEVLEWLDSEDCTLPVPHSQRSRAEVSAEVDWTRPTISHLELIDLAERALGTPVQAAVKRVDEQEFARLNALNPLFCEDAAQRLAAALARDVRIRAYRVGVQHEESLHPHDAVAEVASDTWPTSRRSS